MLNLVERSKADHFDTHLVRPQDGELDLPVDALLRRRNEILKFDRVNRLSCYAATSLTKHEQFNQFAARSS
jgi:hypothetical protein